MLSLPLDRRSSWSGLTILLMVLLLTSANWAAEPAGDAPTLPTGQPLVGPDQLEQTRQLQFDGATTIQRFDRVIGVNGGMLILQPPYATGLLRDQPVAGPAPLPTDAQQIFDQFQQEQDAARRKYEQQLSQATDVVVKQLEALQKKYVDSGKLEDALAVRGHIQMLQARVAQAQAVAQAGPNLAAYRGQVGKTFTFEVVGSINGPLWGSGIYTDDSSPAVAAVHAGLVQPGQRAQVTITLLDGLPAFEGSTANGVTSQAYGPWQGAFKIERAANPPKPDAAPADQKPGEKPADKKAAPAKVMKDPGNFHDCREFIGVTFDCEVTGSLEGKIWGAGIYAEDSPLATAAVHAGVLQPGEKGIVHVTIVAPPEKFEGRTMNGITSLPYGKMGECAYQIKLPQDTPAAIRQKALQRATLAQLRDLTPGPHEAGSSFEIEILGALEGTVWGDGIYTDDSTLAAAAVHAGIIEEGVRAKIKVTLLPGQEAYQGAKHNGIDSQGYGQWNASFKVERAARP